MQHQEKASRNIRNILDKKQSKSRAAIRPCDEYTFYGVTETRSGMPEISLALKLIHKDGRQLIIRYHEMAFPTEYNGLDEIQIHTTNSFIIKIKGSNLDDIIDYLAEHRLVWIKEPDSSFTIMEDKEEVMIESIEVEVLG